MENLTLVRSTAPRKDPRLVIHNIEGRTGSVQFLSTLFGGSQITRGNPPATLTLTGPFPPPKPKETPEQRLAKMEARLLKMKAKLATVTAAAPAAASAPKVTANAAQKTKK